MLECTWTGPKDTLTSGVEFFQQPHSARQNIKTAVQNDQAMQNRDATQEGGSTCPVAADGRLRKRPLRADAEILLRITPRAGPTHLGRAGKARTRRLVGLIEKAR